jgi:hypothetical protein
VRARRIPLDEELLELLGDEPELLAIADAIVETQTPRRRVRRVGLVATAAVVAAVAALAFALWPSGRSADFSVNTAVAAIGGQARVVSMQIDATVPGAVSLSYDRSRGSLTVSGGGPSLLVPAAQLPPTATSLAQGLRRRFGASLGPAVSLLVEYPRIAASGRTHPVRPPDGADRALKWERYDSSLGYAVEVGLAPGSLAPRLVERAGSPTVTRIQGLSVKN